MAFWNIVFALFFALLAFIGFALLLIVRGAPASISLFDLSLVTLATFRLTRLVVYDHIFDFFRDWFKDSASGTFAGTLRSLVNCAWCIGLWFALFVTFFYFLTPYAWFFILFLAIAGVASLVLILGNLLGWQAEGKRREVLIAEAGMDMKNEKLYRIIETDSKCG